MKAKLITVIPVYNGEAFILQTLDSIACQSVQPDRVIVTDNCSTDGTEELVKSFKPLRCEWRKNDINTGCYVNFNRTIEYSELSIYLHLIIADDRSRRG